jgi:hypothetical protein
LSDFAGVGFNVGKGFTFVSCFNVIKDESDFARPSSIFGHWIGLQLAALDMRKGEAVPCRSQTEIIFD